MFPQAFSPRPPKGIFHFFLKPSLLSNENFSTMAAFMAIICFYVHERITIQMLKMIRLLMRTVLTKSFFVHLVTFWRLFTCDQTKTHSHSLYLSGVRYLQNSVLDDATIANENGKNMNEKCPFDFFFLFKIYLKLCTKAWKTLWTVWTHIFSKSPFYH